MYLTDTENYEMDLVSLFALATRKLRDNLVPPPQQIPKKDPMLNVYLYNQISDYVSSYMIH